VARRKRHKQPAALPPDSAAVAPPPGSTGGGRRRLFLAITLLVPLLLFGAAELALRAAGIGALEPLFVPVPEAPGYLQPNPAVVQRFFPDPREAPEVSIDTTWFPAQKAPGTLRIFVQGESSAAGFPYGRFASPAAMLQQRLQRAYPDREVEVIGTGMAAVTSYVLLDLADEIIAMQPDAVVVYAGHNEYLGIGGVGSSLVSARSPVVARAVAQLRRLHVYHALERTLAGLGTASEPFDPRGTRLMARVAAERSIPLGSPLYERGLGQFRGNLDRLLAKYQRAGVPVFIGTLASNERDQPPFASAPVERGEASALARFEQARRLEAAGEMAAARAEYLAAKDRDELRFRAPESFNALIRDVAGARGAQVVDVQAALAAASPGGIIGSTLMLEHVHPNVEGYFRLASAFFPAIVQQAGAASVGVDDEMARRELPVTEVDRLHGEYRVALLKNDWPFVPERRPTQIPGPTTKIEEIAQRWFTGQIGWAQAMEEARAEYQRTGNLVEAARVAVNLADGFVTSADAQYKAAVLLMRTDAADRALRLARRSVELDPTRVEHQLALAQAQFMTGSPEDSIATLEGILKRQPGESRAEYWLAEVRRRTQER
jgi:tetratricopeptide (TPR) repeat protein